MCLVVICVGRYGAAALAGVLIILLGLAGLWDLWSSRSGFGLLILWFDCWFMFGCVLVIGLIVGIWLFVYFGNCCVRDGVAGVSG